MSDAACLDKANRTEAIDLRDLQDRADVTVLVQAFYARAFADPLLGHIFVDVARMDLEQHLPIITDFWETVLFRAGLYHRNALQVHVALNASFPLGEQHFDRWRELWALTVNSSFRGEKAELAKVQADRIAGSIQRRLAGQTPSEFTSISRRERPPL
ncbi:group III truncated hemoglobin [Paenarthrobacter sp. Z7-10]|uniref:group III truncated hemoglobin n=1 Tax=Paenarthrobacter sp. Z7-10 TaxID=2787635 RepID=UPI0022A94B65|nr:group III truncated hemoglobin [Paenarthrobacter sp. Z7-10]MCZ2402465.1 group III truncated hemoglobin [Paenarthrobacter sp. Z7-10]